MMKLMTKEGVELEINETNYEQYQLLYNVTLDEYNVTFPEILFLDGITCPVTDIHGKEHMIYICSLSDVLGEYESRMI